MSALLLILLSAVLVNVIALTSVPAWRPFATLTSVFEGARALAVASMLIVPVVATAGWLLTRGLLDPNGLGYLRTLALVAMTLIVVPLVELALHRDGRLQPQRPGFALLMTTNSAVLGVALIVSERLLNVFYALLLSLGAAAALGFLLLAFAALHERLEHAAMPAVFRHAPVALVTAGIMALAFMGFTGVIQE